MNPPSRRPSLSDVRLSLDAALIAVVAPLVARLRPEAMHRLLETRLRHKRVNGCSDERVLQIIDQVLWRAPRRTPNWCMVRGITAYRMLRGAGREVHLVFGARLVGETLEAHCWLSDGFHAIHEAPNAGTPFDEMFRLTPTGVVMP